MEKIPCIKCNSQLWEYIKPYLNEWGYCAYWVNNKYWEIYPILVINRMGDFGECSQYNMVNEQEYNRELVTNVEEFLERAAKLKGFTYIRKGTMKINGIEIKPGMVLSTKIARYVVFPTDITYKSGYAFANITNGSWSTDVPEDIVAIYNPPCTSSLCSGKTLWKKPKEIVLTMDQIAEKFGIPVEQLKIQK